MSAEAKEEPVTKFSTHSQWKPALAETGAEGNCLTLATCLWGKQTISTTHNGVGTNGSPLGLEQGQAVHSVVLPEGLAVQLGKKKKWKP